MKIFADSFKRWVRVLEAYQEKGNPIGESLYFNFKDKNVYFGSKEGIGRVKFYTEDDEDIGNFFISTNKFLNIITQYDFLNLDSKLVFTNNQDKYKLSTIIDDDKFDNSMFEKTFESSISLTKDSIEKITRSLTYTNKDEQNTNYRNIFIQDKHICSLTTPTPMYENKIDIDCDLIISINVAKTLVQVGSIAEGCSLLSSQSSRKIVSRDEELEIIVPSTSTVEFPSNRNEKFIESYSYNNILKVSTDTFSKVLSVLRPYFNSVLNAKLIIDINDDITIKVSDSQNEVEKHIPYLEINENLNGKQFAISGTKLETALSTLKGKELFIDLPSNDTSPIVNMYNDLESEHVLIVRFKNE